MAWASDRERTNGAGSPRRSLSPARKKPRPTSRSISVDVVGRGCVYQYLHYSRELGFFAIGIEQVFSFRPDWHQDDRAKPLVQQYLTALDSVLRSHPELEECIARCTHCGIPFLTYPQNKGRRDLRCPFGCREHRRGECANRRSARYYGTKEGWRNKKRHNGRRSRSATLAHGPPQDLPPQTAPPNPSPTVEPPREEPPHVVQSPPVDESSPIVQLRLEGVVLDVVSLATSPMLPYVQALLGLIDGIRLSCAEVVHWLRQAMRQRSMGGRRRVDYVLGYLHQHPP